MKLKQVLDKKWIRRVKTFNEIEFDDQTYIHRQYIDGNRAIISLRIENMDDMIHPLSSKKRPILNNDVAEYIEKCVDDIPFYYPIIIKVEKEDFTDDEEILVKRLIHNYFGLELSDRVADLEFNRWKSIILFIIGVVIIFLSFVLMNLGLSSFIVEMVSIFGTFAFWEFADSLVLERNELKIKKLNAGQLATARIIFSKEDIKKKTFVGE